jgi:hypothetical protein
VQRLPWRPVWLVPASDVGTVFWLVRGGLRVPQRLDVGDGGSMWPRAVQRRRRRCVLAVRRGHLWQPHAADVIQLLGAVRRGVLLPRRLHDVDGVFVPCWVQLCGG